MSTQQRSLGMELRLYQRYDKFYKPARRSGFRIEPIHIIWNLLDFQIQIYKIEMLNRQTQQVTIAWNR